MQKNSAKQAMSTYVGLVKIVNLTCFRQENLQGSLQKNHGKCNKTAIYIHRNQYNMIRF